MHEVCSHPYRIKYITYLIRSFKLRITRIISILTGKVKSPGFVQLPTVIPLSVSTSILFRDDNYISLNGWGLESKLLYRFRQQLIDTFWNLTIYTSRWAKVSWHILKLNENKRLNGVQECCLNRYASHVWK